MTSLETYFRVVRSGSIDEVREQLNKLSIDINAQDESGDTLLHLAAAHRDDDVARLLLEKGADVNAKNDLDMTPLIKAAYKRRNLTLRQLLESTNININCRNRFGDTALLLAVKSDGPGFGRTPNVEGVRALLEHRAVRFIRDAAGVTAQEFAYHYLASKPDHRPYQDLLKAFEEIPTGTQAGAQLDNHRRFSIPYKTESKQHRAWTNLTTISRGPDRNPFFRALDIFELSKPPGTLRSQEQDKISSISRRINDGLQWLHVKCNNVSAREACFVDHHHFLTSLDIMG